jgi:methylenetetrahydrofolate dehydrogenase (NADP+)/methenyltetrahydrofolate cyclohydrolase
MLSQKPQVKILSGREASLKWIESLKQSIETLGSVPGLGILQVGGNPASSTYIQQKLRAAQSCGMHTRFELAKATDSSESIKTKLRSLCGDPQVDGIIVQLPLDWQASESERSFLTKELLEIIPPSKDADGLHALNQGRLVAGESTFENWTSPLPATPFGVMKLLELYSISVSGKDCVVVGKSRLVGTPMALLLSQAGATVSICHKKTNDLKAKTLAAQIVVAAAGVKHLLTADHFSPGSIVVDVGIHRTSEGTLTGDVDPLSYPKLSAYSPVPGGVGPMTVAALLQNVLNIHRAFKNTP